MRLLDKIKSLIEKHPSGCWLWKGAIHGKPPKRHYGTIYLGEKVKPRIQKAHRVLFQLKYGPIPRGLFACHKCDNPQCVNPDHIFIGTCADNARDMRQKGRSTLGQPRPYNSGCGNGNCRLAPDEIDLIRQLRLAGATLKSISTRFGCSESTVHRIVNFVTHNTGGIPMCST